MRTAFLLKLLLLLFIPINIQAQQLESKKIKFSFVDKSLKLAFFDLEIAERLDFQFEENLVKDIRISKTIPKMALHDALQELLAGTELSYRLEAPNKVIIQKKEYNKKPAIPKVTAPASQFNLTASGMVKDASSGETLPYANLLVAGTDLGAETNIDGYFTLLNVPSDTSLIEVSYIGYRSQYFRLEPGMNFSQLQVALSPDGEVLQEVIISSTQQEQLMRASAGVSKIAITPAQLTALPSIGERDIFRSLQLLPGVSGSNEGSSGLFVRGGTPDQNLVLFDGFTVYHVDHLFGFFSAFNSNSIKDVQLYKGGFESKFGGRLSSVVEITGKDGNTEQFNAGAGISLLSLNGYAEIPFADGKGSILLAGRRSFQSNFYNNLLDLSGGSPDSNEENAEQPQFGGRGRLGQASTEPNSWFYDLNGKATFRTQKDIFSLSLYNGQDQLDNSRYSDDNNLGRGGFGGIFGGGNQPDFNFQLDVVDKSDWGNTGSSLKWSRRWNDQLYSNALVSYSNYFSYRDRGIQSVVTRDTVTTETNAGTIEDNNLKDYSFKWDWEWQPKALHKVGFGVFGTAFDIKYDFIQNDTINVLNRDDQSELFGAYLQSQSTLGKFIINPGLRVNYFGATGQSYLEPRLQVQYLPNENLKLKLATGRYYQFANRIIREDIAQGSRDFWVLSDGDQVPVSSSDHLIAGIAYETPSYLFDIEAYYKTLDNITEYSTRFVVNGFGRNTSLDFEENFFNGTGTARGVEFLAQKKTGDLTGWISYTLGRIEHQFDVFGEDPYPAIHDVTHELKLVGMYKLGRWTFGGTFVYATGKPYTAPLGAYSVDLLDDTSVSHFTISDKNVLRLPDYHRLDLSANYDLRRFLGGKGTLGFSLFNVYGRNNVWYKEFDVVDGLILETDVNLLGMTPSVSLTWTLH
ncbi:MAG: TonB-dependent receptor, partial [Bacteroidota bacterium]